uniref:Uncharacterized protein n=1 Tax=Cacopsylla melanoneura TaxID=428564 RepID=A0A8D9E730_9HEMI
MDQKRSNSPDCPLKESPTSKNVSKSRAFQIFPTHTCISVLGVAIAHFFFVYRAKLHQEQSKKNEKYRYQPQKNLNTTLKIILTLFIWSLESAKISTYPNSICKIFGFSLSLILLRVSIK